MSTHWRIYRQARNDRCVSSASGSGMAPQIPCYWSCHRFSFWQCAHYGASDIRCGFFQIQQSNMIILDDLSSWRFLKLCPGGYCLTHQTLVGGPDSGFPTYTSAPGLPWTSPLVHFLNGVKLSPSDLAVYFHAGAHISAPSPSHFYSHLTATTNPLPSPQIWQISPWDPLKDQLLLQGVLSRCTPNAADLFIRSLQWSPRKQCLPHHIRTSVSQAQKGKYSIEVALRRLSSLRERTSSEHTVGPQYTFAKLKWTSPIV